MLGSKIKMLALSAVLIAGSVGIAQDAPRPEGERGERQGQRDGQRQRGGTHGWALRGIDLTEEQRTKIRAIDEKHREALQKFRQENAEKFRELREKLRAAREANDEAAMKAAREEMQKLNDTGPMKLVREEIRGVLTDEQKVKFDENLKNPPQRGQRPDGERRNRNRDGGQPS